jgi:hypothetical protein
VNRMADKEKMEYEEQDERLSSTNEGQVSEAEKLVEENTVGQTSLDILWNQAFRELDEWVKHANFRDDVFLKEAAFFAERIKRNQENITVVTEQFTKELAEWERNAREEILMSTTTLQHLLPKISYEEINQQIDQVQNKAMSILRAPCQVIENNQLMDQYLTMVEKYISLRKASRRQYISTIKQAGGLIYESQKGFVDLFTNQLKSLILPFNKYMEKTEELTK